ncbi:hypothetical protein [Williamsia sp. Leaf354]|uniref:hypothetical protein n=1 Tax=Williamsia sp. Leaf354 TaxID=1736349 RepID=UPI000AE42EC7|nr:hypothetical protein [Williamsia sp. Leaf354]
MIDRSETLRLVFVAVISASLAACSTGVPASGGDPTFTPTSQQQVQDTVVEMYRETLDKLPPGYAFDGSRYSSTGNTVDCDDNATNDHLSPVRYSSYRDMKVPDGIPVEGLVEKLGTIWKSLGWSVDERDGFPEPNRFATAPDGYSIHAIVGRPDGYPPALVAGSACFDGKLADKNIQVPAVLRSNE